MSLVLTDIGLAYGSSNGLYYNPDTKDLHWKTCDRWPRYVVQLNETDCVPMFGLLEIDDERLARSRWCGAVHPRIRGGRFGNVQGRSGLLVRKGLRLYVKTNHKNCYTENMLIEDVVADDVCRFSEFYLDWDLVMIVSEEERTVFSAPRMLPKICRFDVEETEVDPSHWSQVLA